MNIIKQTILDSNSIPYIKDQLQHGHLIGKYLSEKISFEKGIVSTFLPEDATSVENFETGGKFPSKGPINHLGVTMVEIPREQSDLSILYQVKKFLEKESTNAFILEDILTKASDSGFSFDAYTVTLGEEVYYVFQDQVDEQSLREKINRSHAGWYFLGVLLRTFSETPKLQISNFHSTKENLLTSVQTIIVSAYDGEGYLMWERAS